jgi:hypothetical protein
VDVPPVVRRNVGRIDAQRLDGINRLQHAFDLRPAVYPQQTLPAGADKADRRTGLARTNGAQDVDARDDGAKIVGRPADESEDAARREGNDTAMPVDDLLGGDAAEAYPALKTLLDPDQIDASVCVGRHGGHDAAPSLGDACSGISRSVPATLTPCWKATKSMRPHA